MLSDRALKRADNSDEQRSDTVGFAADANKLPPKRTEALYFSRLNDLGVTVVEFGEWRYARIIPLYCI
jgi:hypothetical protein